VTARYHVQRQSRRRAVLDAPADARESGRIERSRRRKTRKRIRYVACVSGCGLSNTSRLLGLAAVVGLLATTPPARATGAVLPPGTTPDPTTLDVQVAIATAPHGTTRWSRVTVGGPSRVLWLVPARPGAALDWAPDAWLDALDTSTAPRIVPPSKVPPCGMTEAPEVIASWATTGTKHHARTVVVHETEADARAHAAARGFKVSPSAASRIHETYAAGTALVSVELDAFPHLGTTATLRVSDDGPALLPLALTGSAEAATRVTAFILGEGTATLPGSMDLRRSELLWEMYGSSFAELRAGVLAKGAGSTWLRETATRETLFEPRVVRGSEVVPSLAATYFSRATGSAKLACEQSAAAAGANVGVAGRACAPGALGRVGGGTECSPSAGAVDPSAFTCGAGVDDLALAFSGLSPSSVVVTRFAGVVPRGHLGSDVAITSGGAPLGVVQTAAGYGACPVAPPGAPLTPPSPPATGPTSAAPTEPTYTRTTDGCSGSSTVVVYEDTGQEEPVADEGCGGSTTEPSSGTTSDGESCGGDTTSSSSGTSGASDGDSDDDSGDEWDTDDDDSSSSDDGCASKSSSSSTSSSSSGGWDDEDDMSPSSFATTAAGSASADDGSKSTPSGHEAKAKAKKPKAKKTKNGKPKQQGATRAPRKSSPVSRYALLFVAVLLPLRRRLRNARFTW